MIFAVLGVLLLGVLIGSTGMKRLGRMLRGAWRPGAAGLGLLCLAGGLFLLARALWLEGVLLLGAALALSLSARKRPKLAVALSPQMDRRQAASILGVGVDDPPEAVEAAYRRLMRRAHPDLGGSAGLAAQLNAARSVLTAGNTGATRKA